MDTGGKVIAIDLGAKLAAFTRAKFAAFHNIEVVNIPFEDYKCEDNSINLVYSAQAFHWVSGGRRTGIPDNPLAHQLLVSGGTLAVWWRDIFLSPNDFKKYAPSIAITIKNQTTVNDKKRHVSDCIGIQRFFRFINFHEIKLEMYYENRTLSAKDYIGLLQTSPKYMLLDIKLEHLFLRLFRK